MKYLLPLILVCALLCGCGQSPLLSQTISHGESPEIIGGAEKSSEDYLSGNITGTTVSSDGGEKLFYCTGRELRVWDRQLGIHRRIRELPSHQQPVALLMEDTVLQCFSEESGRRQTFFYSTANGQLLQTFDGEIRVKTEAEGFTAEIPVGDLTVTLFGNYTEQPQMVLGHVPVLEAVPYCSKEKPDTAGLADCRTTARQLGEEYGIQVLLLEDIPENTAAAGEYLVPVIHRELSVLSQRLSVFPENMLRETAAHFSELAICLVRKRSEVLPCAHFRDGNKLYILPESGRSGQELYHALFHAMETHIWGNSKALDHWNELNPAGFAYDEDYAANAVRDSGIYLQGENRAFPSWFAMSFPREDRAEIFAHAMMPGNTELFQTEVMQKKLSSLCTGIREAYGLKNHPQELPWEQYLE